MTDVFNHERDILNAKTGDAQLIYSSIMGMKPDLSGPMDKPKSKNINPENKSISFDEKVQVFSIPSIDQIGKDPESSSDSEEENSDSEDDGESKFINCSRPKAETAEEKKERKKKVKDEKSREKKN